MTYQELTAYAIRLQSVSPAEEAEATLQLAAAYVRQGAIAGRVRAVLADFYRAPLSMSSVQPILDLAVELNPELKEKK